MVDDADDSAASTADHPTWLDATAAEPGSSKPDPILVIDDVSRSFGGLKAVDVDHLEVQRGAITGLIGPNGAGKTTLFNLLTGFDRADTGSWKIDGKNLSRMQPHRVARHGVVHSGARGQGQAAQRIAVQVDQVRVGYGEAGAEGRQRIVTVQVLRVCERQC